jgi:hypothetical protein
MAKKTTLEEIGEMLTHVVKHMATKDDLADMRREMATKEQIIALHGQVNAIERQLRDRRRKSASAHSKTRSSADAIGR